MSSMPDRKFNSILKRIPVETVFDVLKFLTYEQWFALQFSNWRLAEIIKKNENYLAFPKLYYICFRKYNERFTPSRNITFDGFTAKVDDLDEKEKSDLTESFAKLNQVPLALIPSDENPDNENFFYIYIRKTENVGDYLLIKLPVHPSTIEELELIRFWLLRLSQTHFGDLYANYVILNPEFLSVLNPKTGPRKILFHANQVDLRDSHRLSHRLLFPQAGCAIRTDFAQFIRARQIYLQASFLDEPHRNNIFRFITGTGNSLEKFHFRSFGANMGELCEFLVKSIMHMEASSLESVPEIIECGAYGRGSAYGKGWPNIPGAKFTDSVDLPFFKRYRYTFNNLWNKKVMFGLDLIGREFLESLKIVKITTKE